MADRKQRRKRGLLAVISAIAITVATASFFTVPASAAVRRGATPQGPEADSAIAKLVVEHDEVDVRKADKDAFRPAEDGQELHEGDTVRTDETGRATIFYTDKSYTRLDVSTEFTIVELTDDQGTRQTDGSVDTGRVWNRVEDLAENESFSTAGAGATAAVTGTAYFVSCPTVDECEYTGVHHTLTLDANNGQPPQDVGELQHITVKLGSPGDVEALSVEEFLADSWVQDNLLFDAFLGFAGPNLHVTVVTFGGATVFIPTEVGGLIVQQPPDGVDPPPPPPPPPPTSPTGFGAGGGTNQGGASFGGVGNCMASSAQGKAGGSKPDPDPCLGG